MFCKVLQYNLIMPISMCLFDYSYRLLFSWKRQALPKLSYDHQCGLYISIVRVIVHSRKTFESIWVINHIKFLFKFKLRWADMLLTHAWNIQVYIIRKHIEENSAKLLRKYATMILLMIYCSDSNIIENNFNSLIVYVYNHFWKS